MDMRSLLMMLVVLLVGYYIGAHYKLGLPIIG